jgi:NAD(P)H dehydrogenase (quinone)
MNILMIVAHPEPNSFNHAMANIAQEVFEAQGHQVQVSDLYAMGWDPVSDRRNFKTVKAPDYFKQQTEELHATETESFAEDIAAEQDKLEWCDVLIFQFPLWWFSMPAILKGWVDRVFAMGKTYGGGQFYDKGFFKGKRAMIAMTTGGPETMYSETGLNGHLESLLFPINHGIFGFVGFEALPPFVIYSPAHLSQEQREAALAGYKEHLETFASLVPINYPLLSAYDEKTLQLK